MSRIDRTFESLKQRGQSALIPFLMAGHPDLETTEALIPHLAKAGADIIELGVPFSDPLADGPTLQAASHQALQKGVHLKDILSLAEGLKEIDTPLVLMTYFNPIFRYGLKKFAEDCQKSRIDGVIIPDLPPEEADPWVKEARRVNLDTVFLAAPTSPPERLKRITRVSRGYIYYVSLTGVTGTREQLPADLEPAVRRVRQGSQKPVAVGFGISSPEQAREVSRFSDGVIIGSAIARIIEENTDHPGLVDRVREFVSSVSRSMRGSSGF